MRHHDALPLAHGSHSHSLAQAQRRGRHLTVLFATALLVTALAGEGQAMAAAVAAEPPHYAAGATAETAEVGQLVDVVSDDPTGRWTAPVAPTVIHPFDPPAERWLAGHRGVDFAAAAGTTVVSPAAGIVTFAGPVGGRAVLVVTHDGGLRSSFEPVTATVPVGSRVSAGTPIGVLDPTAGHCAPATCLHWGVRQGSSYLDPLLLLGLADPIVLLPLDGPPPGARLGTRRPDQMEKWAGSTQGYDNGELPDSIMCSPSFDSAARLRCDAAHQLDALNTAFRDAFGHDLGITDSYRSYSEQVATKAAKGYLAAKPGTSNHGWGIAVDLKVTSYGSDAYQWLRDNAPHYGWDNPTWARPGGNKNEPWHWEYGTGS